MEDINGKHLEPRVARLETGLESLTANVKDLASVVREQGNRVEGQIQALTVAVTSANAPKKTDWSVIIAAVGLVMAIGAAVMIPINQTSQDNKLRLEQYHASMVEHMKLDMHPVGMALVQRLEGEVKLQNGVNEKAIEALDKKLQLEYSLMNATLHEKQTALERETILVDQRLQKEMQAGDTLMRSELAGQKAVFDLYIDKLYGRVVSLEQSRIAFADKDHEELMLWRQKAMGLSVPSAVVPLIPRDTAK